MLSVQSVVQSVILAVCSRSAASSRTSFGLQAMFLTFAVITRARVPALLLLWIARASGEQPSCDELSRELLRARARG